MILAGVIQGIEILVLAAAGNTGLIREIAMQRNGSIICARCGAQSGDRVSEVVGRTDIDADFQAGIREGAITDVHTRARVILSVVVEWTVERGHTETSGVVAVISIRAVGDALFSIFPLVIGTGAHTQPNMGIAVETIGAAGGDHALRDHQVRVSVVENSANIRRASRHALV